jgi:hypothetical protein
MESATIDCPFSSVKITPNPENNRNNSDSWEITITTQQAMFINHKETNTLTFIVVGGCELHDIADALSQAVKVAR